MEYELIRSKRKTLAIEIKADGGMVVRVPEVCSRKSIEAFVTGHSDWISEKVRQQIRQQEERALQNPGPLTEEERQRAICEARVIFSDKVRFYAEKMQVEYGRITIREQKTRWGSCSAKGNLNFNWRLLLAPEEALDYVVVHELAHRRHMNHSKAFYQVVSEVMPDYRKQQRWLKENGWKIL